MVRDEVLTFRLADLVPDDRCRATPPSPATSSRRSGKRPSNWKDLSRDVAAQFPLFGGERPVLPHTTSPGARPGAVLRRWDRKNPGLYKQLPPAPSTGVAREIVSERPASGRWGRRMATGSREFRPV